MHHGIDLVAATGLEVALLPGIDGAPGGIEAETQAGFAGRFHPPAHPLSGLEHRYSL